VFVGNGVGIGVGLLVAPFDGSIVLAFVGFGVGFGVGLGVGIGVGIGVGLGVGIGVLPPVEATVDESVGLGDGLKLEDLAAAGLVSRQRSVISSKLLEFNLVVILVILAPSVLGVKYCNQKIELMIDERENN